MQVRKFENKYWPKGFVHNNAGNWQSTPWEVLPKKITTVQVAWKAAVNAGTQNGYIKLFVDGTLIRKKRNINNDTINIKSVRLGITKNIPAAYNISGYFYLDHFGSDNSVIIDQPFP